MIFSGKNLVDCEFIDDGGDFVREFIEKFNEDVSFIRNEKLSSTKHAKHHQYHESMNLKNIDNELLTMKSTAKITPLKKLQNIPEHLHELMNMKKLKKKCNQLHRRIRQNIRGEEDEDNKEEGFDAEIDSENMKRYEKVINNCLLIDAAFFISLIFNFLIYFPGS